MYDSLKREIEKEFNKERNYNTILFEGERVNDMKKERMKSILATACIAFIALVCLLMINNIENQRDDIKFSKNDKFSNVEELQKEKLQMEININEIESIGSMMIDADLRVLELNELPEKFNFIQNIKIPERYNFKNSYNIFVKSNIDVKKYDKLHDYIFVYQKDELNDIQIAFSEEAEPLRDYYLGEINKKSKIGDIEVIISEYESMHNATFKYRDIYFDIETNGVTKNELVELLVSIINEKE